MEVGEGQELEDNEEIDKMADKDMIKNNDVTDRLEVMFMMVEEDTKKDNYGELEMALEVVNHW